MKFSKKLSSLFVVGAVAFSVNAMADCGDLPSQQALETALIAAVGVEGGNGGFGLPMWATIVDRDGTVCAVAKSGEPGDQWPGSRVISAQKANTANAFSLPGLALSTANLFSATQPGGSLYGLQHSNPVDASLAYEGDGSSWGTPADPLAQNAVKIGGVNVFGGGLALYDSEDGLLGALGVSGDSSCADHNIAWRVRGTLGLDNVPGGVNPNSGDDNIVYDIVATNPGQSGFESSASESGWGHPVCSDAATEIAESFPSAAATP